MFGIPGAWLLVIGSVVALGLFGVLNALTNRRYVFEDGLVHGVVGRMGSGKSLFIVQRVLMPFCRRLSKRGVIYSTTERPVRRVITNFKFDPRLPNVEVLHVVPTETTNIFEELIELSVRIGGVEGPWYDEDAILQDGRRSIPDDAVSAMLPNGKRSFERQPILNALVILDEMHFFAQSSKIAISEAAGYAFSMARKWNAELWWCSQSEMKVHKRLRDESSYLWLAGKLTGPAAWVLGDRWHICRQYSSPALVERARQAGMSGKDAPRSNERRFYRYTKAVGRIYNSFELLQPDPSRRLNVASPAVQAGTLLRMPSATRPVVGVQIGETGQPNFSEQADPFLSDDEHGSTRAG